MEYDPGPPGNIADLFGQIPDHSPYKAYFWYDWGPVFYRGRLDGSARVLCVASDPGATERVALRTLVGDAGQRTQGFLGKIGLTRSYVCLNAFAYSLFPSRTSQAAQLLEQPELLSWRNQVYDAVAGPDLQAVVAFGVLAQRAVSLWPGAHGKAVIEIPHPSSRDERRLLREWKAAVTQLRAIVTPDPDGRITDPNYGSVFGEADYAPIPRWDLPFGVPPWLGDDSKGRKASPPKRDCVTRPKPDDRHTLIWVAPRS